MPFEDMVKQVAVTLERDGSVQAVFGQSIELQHHTIVPVAVVTGGGGGGGSQGTGDGSYAGGMGIGLNVRPVGFIYEQGDDVVFTPIHVDGRTNRPLWTEAAFGVRRAIDLATAVVTQFMHRQATKIPVRTRPAAGTQDEEVTSPS
jgi:uncharacterized spore protein YtfJ